MQTYTYTYDALNRLKKAAYSGATGKANHYNEELAYDVMGNIDTLRRSNGSTAWYNHFKYSYTGNKLGSVTDAGTAVRSNSFTYDANGNAKTNTRLGITDIEYNFLNLPRKFVKGSENLQYTYDATGRKLTKTLGSAVTQYVDGIQYKNGVLEFIQTEEGRILPNGSSYIYEYFLTDHLGNTRAVVDHTGAVKQIQDYYPFGMELNQGSALNTASNQYKYNGKEKQVELGLDQLDYGARFYDAEIGRWNVVDPLAEMHFNFTPYNYVLNDPINYVDPWGLDTVRVNDVVWPNFKPDQDVIQIDEVVVNRSVKKENTTLDNIQTGLDVVGLVPGLGEVADGINALIYLVKGDYLNASLSAAAMIPLVGTGATTLKFANKIQKHHIIPNAVYKTYKKELKKMGYIQNNAKNLKKLSTPFHGNHPAYNKTVDKLLGDILNSGGDINDVMDLQKTLRHEINDKVKEGHRTLNEAFK